MSNICDFDRILKTECNLQYFTRNCRIKNLDDYERDEADAYLWRAGRKNINVVPGQLSCCQCKAKFLLEANSLY